MTTLAVILAALLISSSVGALLLWARRRGDAAVRPSPLALTFATARLALEAATATAREQVELELDRFTLAMSRANESTRRFGRAVEDLALHTGSLRTWTPDAADELAGRTFTFDTELERSCPTVSTHRITLQVHVDDDELDRQRAAYIAAYPEDEELDNFYGRPADWRSILDVVDAQEAGVILRSELVDRELNVEPFDPYQRPSRWRRLLATVGLGVLLSVALASPAAADTITGTSRADWLWGTQGLDYMIARGGADHVFGLAGPDDLAGGRGDDYLAGLRGDDYLLGGPGRDELRGGRGYDVCYGGPDPDLFVDCDFLVDFRRSTGDRRRFILENPPPR